MKVALIGDIQANLPALEAVLAHAGEQGAQAVWNVGDSLGCGPFPDEVVRRLRKHQVQSVVGDYDRKVLRFKKRREKWLKKKRPEDFEAIEWAYEGLSKKSRRWLRFLSRELRITVKGRRVLLAHVCPGWDGDGLASDLGESDQDLSLIAGAEIVVCGPPQEPFARKLGDTWVMTPGSTGLPGAGEPRASYVLMEVHQNLVETQAFHVSYDLGPLLAAMTDRELPASSAAVFQV